MYQAVFEMRKWMSNSKTVLDSMNGEDRTANKNLNVDSRMAVEKTLGMWWDSTNNTFTFNLTTIIFQEILNGQQVPTKREVLRILMTIFDLLGFLANVLMYLKILPRKIWRARTKWDEPIKSEHFNRRCNVWNVLSLHLKRVKHPYLSY